MITSLPLPELNRLAYDALFEKLGPSQAIRFLREYSQGHGDSIQLKDRAFEGMDVDDIFAAAIALQTAGEGSKGRSK